VIVELQHMGHYSEAELVGARVGAAQMAFITQSDESTAGPEQSEEPAELEANPGTLVRLAPGEDVKEWTPSHPNTAYGDFMKHLTRRISSGMGVSYGALANDPSDASWSNARTALQLERELWVMLQEDWIAQFCQPVYERWLNAAILSGELVLPSMDWRRFTAASWVARKWDWVDPLKDLQAAKMGIEMGLTSRTQLLAEQGQELEDVFEHLQAESKLAGRLGIDVTGAGAGGAQAKPGGAAGSDDEDGRESEESPEDDELPEEERASRRSLKPRPAVAAALTNGKAH
jgi:lambda family phage portal protein